MSIEVKPRPTISNLRDLQGHAYSMNGYADAAMGTNIVIDSVAEWNTAEGTDMMLLAHHSLGLTGEAGEVAGKVKKLIRDKQGQITRDDQQAIAKELGDVLWYVAALCRELGVSMQDVAHANLVKLYDRKDRGALGGSGDDR